MVGHKNGICSQIFSQLFKITIAQFACGHLNADTMMSFWVLLAYQGYKALSGIVSRRWRSLLHPALALTAAGGFSALLPLIFGGASGDTW